MVEAQEPLENPRHERFAREYAIDRNGVEAYLRAGYAVRNRDIAGVNASRLLAQAKIEARVAYLETEHLERIGLEKDEVLAELAILVRSDVRHYQLDEAGSLGLAEGAPDEAMRAVASVKITRERRLEGTTPIETQRIEYRLWDKSAALKMAGQYHNLWKERVELSGPNGGPIQQEDLTQRETAGDWLMGELSRIAARQTAAATRRGPQRNGKG
jgi:phage terminase small subunit